MDLLLTIKPIEGIHKDKSVIWLPFEYNSNLILEVKKMGGKWSQSNRSWYLNDTPTNRNLLGLEPKFYGKDVLCKIHLINQKSLIALKELLLLKAYSPSTIRTYLIEFAQLLYILKERDVNNLSLSQIKAYCLYCITSLNISEAQMHSRINALKFYFEKIRGWDSFMIDIPRPKKQFFFFALQLTHA